LAERLKLIRCLFVHPDIQLFTSAAQMLRLGFAAPPRKPSKKGLSDFSQLWYVLCTANSRAQDADEPLGRQQASSLRAVFDAVFSFTRIVWKGIGCGGTNAHDDAALD
jgi:hypothetical protein